MCIQYNIVFTQQNQQPPFSSAPFVFIELIGTDSGSYSYADSFQTSVSNVTPTGFTLNIIRSDGVKSKNSSYGKDWGQQLKIFFMAVEINSLSPTAPDPSTNIKITKN